MRHRGQNENSQTEDTTTPNGLLVTRTDLMATTPNAAGKHRAPVVPVIPVQNQPTHDDKVVEAPVEVPVVPEQSEAPEAAPESATETSKLAALERAAAVRQVSRGSRAAAELQIPHTAQWRASQLPRILAGSLLVVAAAGTTALAVRYAGNRTSEDFISLAIGVGVVVVLWAVLIASTPQVVSLDGSMLTVRNTSGSETFDLSDGLQAVDVVGDPRTSYWAVLLHRPNATTVVLRRNDVNPAEVDPIVRHYRAVATRRFVERQARFSS